jgi:hypothetical protein
MSGLRIYVRVCPECGPRYPMRPGVRRCPRCLCPLLADPEQRPFLATQHNWTGSGGQLASSFLGRWSGRLWQRRMQIGPCLAQTHDSADRDFWMA